VSLSNP